MDRPADKKSKRPDKTNDNKIRTSRFSFLGIIFQGIKIGIVNEAVLF